MENSLSPRASGSHSDVPDVHTETTCDYASEAAATELVRILDQYLADLKGGHAPTKAELMARHPAIAGQLEACLAGLEFIHGAETLGGGGEQRLGDFRIIREIGRGGMGVVFEAEQVSLGRRIALKILRFGGVPDPEAVERFQREAETVANLHHTNIVPIFAVGNERGVNYYAMQFIEGQSLAEVLGGQKGLLPTNRVAEWGLQATEALMHAHQRGIIHRDIKPSNLLLDKEGRVWLTDFGLARKLDDVTLSLTGALLGTPRYMSPEQAGASKTRIDHRTDLFSLGATLYELLTAIPAFPGDMPHDVINSILTCEPRPIREIAKGVPRDLDTIIMKCLAKEPSQRYNNARDLADDLRAFHDGRPIRARRATLVELAARWFKSQQRSAKLIATAATVTFAVMLLSLLGWSGFNAWRQGSVKLSTPTPPLVAEVLDQQGTVLRRETVPTQEAISVPAGEYQIRASDEGTLSQTFDVEIPRGTEGKYALDLGDVNFSSDDINRTYAYVDLGRERLSLMLIGNGGVSLHGQMPPPIGPDTPAWKECPGFRWPWSQGASANSGFGAFDLQPWVAPRGSDLNGDGAQDVICAGRHQAWLMAVSGKDGSLLWFSPKGEDLKVAPENRWLTPMTSGLLGEPIIDHDCDKDGVNDVIATLIDVTPKLVRSSGGQIIARSWVEAVSGKTGKTLWTYELSPKWFELPPGVEVPYEYRWFAGSGTGSSTRGGGWARSGKQVYRQLGQVERNGTHAYRPEAARRVNLGSSSPLAVVAGTHVVQIDPDNGKEVQRPLDFAIRPGKSPEWSDMDGDGVVDLIILSERTTKPTFNIPKANLSVWSLALQKELWSKELDADWPVTQAWTIDPPRWPIVVDLNGDGKSEVIVPNASSSSGRTFFGSDMGIPWGGLVALEGLSGKKLWSREIVSMDQQLSHFKDGPDIDGDGWREVYVATLSGSDFGIYVDALSGQSGKTLWNSKGAAPPTDSEPLLAPLKWWNAGEDGWPQLLVQAVDDHTGLRHSLVCCFSAGTGRMSHFGRGITDVQTRDVDCDGVEDLLIFNALPPANMRDFGGKLQVIRGVPAEPWRRIGMAGEPAADFDGDGVTDLLQSEADGSVQARSGRNCTLLWRNKLGRGTGQTGLRRAGHDLDGDGVEDVLAWTDTYGPRRTSFPFHGLSGRTGKLLWKAQQFDVKMVTNVLTATTADLDHDGNQEAIWLAATDHDFPAQTSWSSHDVQLWLLVTSGQTGITRWAKPLSPAFGMVGGATLQVQVSQAHIKPTIADLDHDGIDDLIVPGITADGLNIETIAVSGKDGHSLWSRPFPRNPSHSPPSTQRWVAPAVANLPDDDSSQAVLVEFGQPDDGQAGGQPTLRVIAIDSKKGVPRWSWGSKATPGSWSSISGPVSEGDLLRPVVLRGAGGRKFFAVSIPGNNAQIVVFDTNGKVHERPLGHQSHITPLWPCDVNDDGVDELVFLERSVLTIAPFDNLETPLWRRDTKSDGGVRILGISPAAADSHPAGAVGKQAATIALLENQMTNTVLGLDAASGKVVWTCPGPIPRTEERHVLLIDQIALLASGSKQPPFVYYAYAAVARCRQAAFFDKGEADSRGSAMSMNALSARGVLAVPALLKGMGDDSRWQRSLPWAGFYFSWRSGAVFWAWGVLFSMLLVVAPGGYVIRLVWLRRFGLKMLLALPLIAGLFLSGVLATGPGDIDFETLRGRLSMGFMLAPVVVGVGLLCWWSATGKWRRVAHWLGVTVALAFVGAVLTLWQDRLERPLLVNESYDWTGWYMIWFPGAFATAWIAMILLPLKYFAVSFWNRWRGRQNSKALANSDEDSKSAVSPVGPIASKVAP